MKEGREVGRAGWKAKGMGMVEDVKALPTEGGVVLEKEGEVEKLLADGFGGVVTSEERRKEFVEVAAAAESTVS